MLPWIASSLNTADIRNTYQPTTTQPDILQQKYSGLVSLVISGDCWEALKAAPSILPRVRGAIIWVIYPFPKPQRSWMWGDIGLQQLGQVQRERLVMGEKSKVKILPKVSFWTSKLQTFIPKLHFIIRCSALIRWFGYCRRSNLLFFRFFFDRFFGCWVPMWSFGRSWCEVFGWGMTSCWQTRTVTASFGGRRRDFGPFIGLVNGEQKINGGEQSWCLDDENKITHVWFVVWLYWR